MKVRSKLAAGCLRLATLAVIGIFDSVVLLLVPGRGGGVAVVRLDGIGDFILWLDSARELARHFDGRPITLIAEAAWADLAARLPYWNEVIAVDAWRLRYRPFYRFRLQWLIRRKGFEMVVHPTFSRTFLTGDALVHATGARETIAFDSGCRNTTRLRKRLSDRWYTRLIHATPGPMMELRRNAEFVSALTGIEFKVRRPTLPRLAQLPKRLEIAEPYFIVFPGAGWSEKRWPIGAYAALLDELGNRTGLRAVVCGNVEDQDLCAELVTGSRSEVLNLAGMTSLTDLAELIRAAKLLIGNDTGAVHLAAAVGTPSICILGGGHYGRFLPYDVVEDADDVAPIPVIHRMECYGCDWKCIFPLAAGQATPCISGISLQQVQETAEKLVRRHSLSRAEA